MTARIIGEGYNVNYQGACSHRGGDCLCIDEGSVGEWGGEGPGAPGLGPLSEDISMA